jgi:hypothetical protein
MPGLCRYDALASEIAHLDGAVLTEPLESCGEPQEYAARLAREDGDGFAVETYTNVCRAHDALISLAEGYLTSRKLRTSST